MKIIAIINYKGGVGKTTSTVNIGAGLARQGRRVLLVDTDPQSNLTTIAGFSKNEANTLYQAMKNECELSDAIRTESTLGCSVLPSCEKLAALQKELVDAFDRERILSGLFEEILEKPDVFGTYDYALIDCLPTRNLLNDNALVAADEAYIPVQTEHLSAQGLGLMNDLVTEMRRKRVNTRLRITGVIPTLFKTSQKACHGVLEALREAYSKEVFRTVIRDNVALREAPAHKKDIFQYAPNSLGALDYGNLVSEILERENVGNEVNNGN